jgi:hypothetical protein
VEWWAQWAYRIAALALAFAAGWLVGQGRPSWRSDRFSKIEERPQDGLLDLAQPRGLLTGCLSLLPVASDDAHCSCSGSSLFSVVLMSVALLCAAHGWPTLRLDPLQASPFEFLALLFQRWLWFTIAAFLLGCLGGGAAALSRKDWFR